MAQISVQQQHIALYHKQLLQLPNWHHLLIDIIPMLPYDSSGGGRATSTQRGPKSKQGARSSVRGWDEVIREVGGVCPCRHRYTITPILSCKIAFSAQSNFPDLMMIPSAVFYERDGEREKGREFSWKDMFADQDSCRSRSSFRETVV